MKTMSLTKANKPLSEYARKIKNDVLILTSDGAPVAAVVSLKNMDWESVSLGSNPEFMKLVEKSRKEFKAGKKLTLDEMKKEVARMK